METENILEKGLLIELGIEDVAPEVQESVLDSFTGAVIKKMLVRAFELLPEDKRGELVALQDSEDSEKIEQFLKENIPDFDKVTAEVVESAKESELPGSHLLKGLDKDLELIEKGISKKQPETSNEWTKGLK